MAWGHHRQRREWTSEDYTSSHAAAAATMAPGPEATRRPHLLWPQGRSPAALAHLRRFTDRDEGDQGRIPPLRSELLPALLPAARQSQTIDTSHQPSRLPWHHPPMKSDDRQTPRTHQVDRWRLETGVAGGAKRLTRPRPSQGPDQVLAAEAEAVACSTLSHGRLNLGNVGESRA